MSLKQAEQRIAELERQLAILMKDRDRPQQHIHYVHPVWPTFAPPNPGWQPAPHPFEVTCLSGQSLGGLTWNSAGNIGGGSSN